MHAVPLGLITAFKEVDQEAKWHEWKTLIIPQLVESSSNHMAQLAFARECCGTCQSFRKVPQGCSGFANH